MELADKVRIMTADLGFQRYVVILVAGYRQSCDYFQEIFIVRGDDPLFYYERRDTGNTPLGTTHEERCDMLLQLGLIDAKFLLMNALKTRFELTKELVYYEARQEVDNLKDNYQDGIIYLRNDPRIRNIVAEIKVKTYSEDLKTTLLSQ